MRKWLKFFKFLRIVSDWSCPDFPNLLWKIHHQPNPTRVWSCTDFPNLWRKIHPQPASPDRVWSCPGFPNLLRKIHPQPAIFRHEFGKLRSCLIFTENLSPAYMATCLHANMPTCLNWTCLILSGLNRSDPVQVSQIRYEEEGEHKTYF